MCMLLGWVLPLFLSFTVLIFCLIFMYTFKYVWPLNYLMLFVFSVIQVLCFVAVKTIFNTNAIVYISGSTFIQIFLMYFLSTRTFIDESDGVLTPVSFYYAAAQAAAINFVINIIIAVTAGEELKVSFMGFCFSAIMSSALLFWFSYDASCMVCKMSPDEYMQAVIFFYTDVVLFIIFMMAMCACLMMGEGGGEMGGCCAEAEFGAAGALGAAEFGDAGGAEGMGGMAGEGGGGMMEGGGGVMEGGMAGGEGAGMAGGEGAGMAGGLEGGVVAGEGAFVGGAAAAEGGTVGLYPLNGVDGHAFTGAEGQNNNQQNRYPAQRDVFG